MGWMSGQCGVMRRERRCYESGIGGSGSKRCNWTGKSMAYSEEGNVSGVCVQPDPLPSASWMRSPLDLEDVWCTCDALASKT